VQKLLLFVCTELTRCFQNLRFATEFLSAVLKLLQTKSIVGSSFKRSYISLWALFEMFLRIYMVTVT